MRRLTLLLLLDAFRPDYLKHAPYLRELAGGAASQLREPFGFLPRGAYFGGLTPEQVGFTNMYAYDPVRSPFGIARALDVRRHGADLLQHLGARAMIDRSAVAKVKPFARSYASCARIPIDLLPSFDLAEQLAPWDRRVGYRSIFHEIEDRGHSWFECSWPGTNTLADHSDQGIVAEALKRARPDARLGFVHLQELDACGHRFGPESAETRDCIAATDVTAAELIETLRARWDAVDLVLFGDHGMVSVTRTVDAVSYFDRLPLTRARDYTYFVDSTMIRVWLHTDAARRLVPPVLASVPGARLLSADDLRRYQMEGCDPRNGELFLLADPGVVFQPNFFQEDGGLRGMHGYDPDCDDNRGVLIVCSDRLDPPSGVVDATELYTITCRLLFEKPDERQVERHIASKPGADIQRFTQATDPAANEAVASHLRTIIDAVIAEIGAPRAIVVTGSFGRGEGGVLSEDGRFVAVNDYDVLVVDDVDCSDRLAHLRSRLPSEIGIDYVDLAWSNGQWRDWQPSIANVDLKYGNRVIYGDPRVMDSLPAFATADIPLSEGLQLALNRIAGILSGMTMVGTASTNHDRRRRYLINQYVKAAVALGDTYLLEWRGYDCSYLTRARRFGSLAPGFGIPPSIAARVVAAYALKVRPDYEAIPDIDAALRDLIPAMSDRVRALVSKCGDGELPSTLEAAMNSYLALPMTFDAATDNALLAGRAEIGGLLKRTPTDASIRRLLYSTLPLVLAAGATRRAPACLPSSWPAASWLDVPHEVEGWPAWNQLRERVVSAWLAAIH